MGKRRRTEDPLNTSVNTVVREVTNWEDACGGKFTVETKIIKGEDYIMLRLFNVDEFRVCDLMKLVNEVSHVVSVRCDFSDESIDIRFEETFKRKKHDPLAISKTSIDNEYNAIVKMFNEEDPVDAASVAKYVATIKECLTTLQQTKVHFDITTTPGIIALTVKGLTRIDIDLFRHLDLLCAEKKEEAVIFLSPPESQSIRIRIKKSKRTVNL